MSETPYNPLDKKNLGVSVADAMLSRPVSPLPPPTDLWARAYTPSTTLGSSPLTHQ